MTLTQISTNGIKDANVNTADIADNAVTRAKITDGEVINAKLDSNAVTTSKINNNAVTSDKIADNAVTTGKIADQAVTLAKLEHGTSSNDGKFLRANNGADPTFETITGTTINNNADNRVITGSGTANTLNGESTLTYNGTTLDITKAGDNAELSLISTGGSGQHFNIRSINSNGRLAVGTATNNHFLLEGSNNNVIIADNAGKVGIGTTSPQAVLHVEGGSEGNLIQLSNTNTGATSSDGFVFGINSSLTYLYNRENKDITFGTNNLERMRIDSSGNIGIQTNDVKLSGAGTLRINSGSTSGLLTLDGGSTNRGGEIGLYGGSNGGRILFRTGQGSGQQGEKMRLDENGNLGIGTADPDNNLQIQKANGGGDVALRVTNASSTDSGTTASLYLTTSPSTNFNTAYIQAKRADGSLNFGYGNNTPGVVFYGPNGDVTCRKPVKTIQNTVVQDTSGDRFQIDLPSTSRMFRVTGSFKFDGNGGTYRIWGDLGSWSDSHTPALEGVANWWVNGATGDLEQDVISGRYFEAADPVDASNCEVTYDLLITTQAFNGSDSGQRPGVSGNISWTYSQVGRAWTVFSYQDINASGTDRLTTWSWDIDIISGSMGTGTHHYVIEEYPLTAQ